MFTYLHAQGDRQAKLVTKQQRFFEMEKIKRVMLRVLDEYESLDGKTSTGEKLENQQYVRKKRSCPIEGWEKQTETTAGGDPDWLPRKLGTFRGMPTF